MRDTPTKPLPARPPEREPPSGSTKPTPARALAGTEIRERPDPVAARRGHGARPDVDEAVLEAEGATWTVRVLGRSGRSTERSPPLLLLGFWPEGGVGEHAREATVVARTLSELSPSRLEDALAGAAPPPENGDRKPFFDAAAPGRRGGPPQRDG